ncbi:MAG: hypothetical protein HY904_20920 [Deltaproteobacteria bacterium]|nr:hypothetical protein [Deltaproteobacteria bacterium]
MDVSFLSGGVGTVVSISIGLLTSFLAERRARRTRWHTAKDIILRDLAVALAEGNPPNASAILATMRSVMREYSVSGRAGTRLQEVVDDMVRAIVSDPFLEPDRRRQLQNAAMGMHEVSKTREFESPIAASQRTRVSPRSIIVGISSMVIAGLMYAGGTSVVPTLQTIPPEYRTNTAIMVALVVACLLILAALMAFSDGSPRRDTEKR